LPSVRTDVKDYWILFVKYYFGIQVCILAKGEAVNIVTSSLPDSRAEPASQLPQRMAQRIANHSLQINKRCADVNGVSIRVSKRDVQAADMKWYCEVCGRSTGEAMTPAKD
jgi:hypothetical protein